MSNAETPPNDPNELPTRALKKIRALCKGNGVKVDQVNIKKSEGSTVKCEALTHIEIHTEVTHETKKGKSIIGNLMKDPAEIEKDITQTVDKLLKNDETRKKISNLLIERPDQGFSLHGEYFALDALSKSYTLHEACKSCNGHSKTACNRCNGRKQEMCTQCHGKTLITCMHCRGSGYMQGAEGKQIQCNKCHGRQQSGCPLCQKRGTINCRQCRGVGTQSCSNCGGAGIFAHVTNLVIKLKTLFEIDRTTIPNNVVPLMENNGSNLVEKKHILIEAEAVRRKDDGLAIKYATQFPYGDLDISIGKNTISFNVFGYNCKLLKVPPFLDKLTAKGFKEINKAAAGEGSVSEHIQNASKYRLVNNAINLSLTMPKKRAYAQLKKKYPMGASDKRLHNLIIFSNKAFANVTRKPRYVGLGIALFIISLLDAAYFIGPIRGIVMPHLQNDMFKMLADLSLIPIGGLLGAFIIKTTAKRSMQKVLATLKNAGNGKIPSPKTHSSGLWSFIGAAVILLIIVEITRHTGALTPAWYFLK